MNPDPSAHGTDSAGAIDSEHQVQIGLVRALCDAVRSGADAGQTRQILQQVVEYSDVHFLSEQLLMRLCSYPEYHDHVKDHADMMDQLRGVAARNSAGDSANAYVEARDVLAFLSRHIATRDRRFGDYYLDWSGRTADLGAIAPDLKQ
jgi:hemerythrin